MNRFSKSRGLIGVVCAIAANLFAAHEACGEWAYLPSVGSPPLRFQVVNTNHLVFNLESFAQPPKAAETSNAVPQIAASAANAMDDVEVSNPIPVSAAIANQTNPVPAKPETGTDAKKSSLPPFNFGISSSSASDLLTVTPQMITEYLKPAQNQTDRASQTNQTGAVTFVPAEMQFTPPPPKAPDESQAIYKTQ